MKRYLAGILVILVLIVSASVVVASDISSAKYLTKITINNTGADALTDAVAVFDLSTPDMIAGDLLNATADDLAMLTGLSGNDLKVMPSSNSTNKWVTWVNSIGAYSQINEYLYHRGATGGEIVYFPADAGMLTADNSTAELSDNGTVAISGYFDTSAGADKYQVSKPGAFDVVVSDSVDGTLTADILTTTWTSPTSSSGAGWANLANAYDDNTATYAEDTSVPVNSWSELYSGNMTPADCVSVRFFANFTASVQNNINLDVYHSGAWQDVYDGIYPNDTWEVVSLGGVYEVGGFRVRFYNDDDGVAQLLQFEEFDFGVSTVSQAVTATGVTTGEHDVVAGIGSW